MNFKLSKYQQDIIDYVKFNKGNLLIDAKAGSGKTSTLLLIAEELNRTNQSCLFLSFNKSIVEELKSKLPSLENNIKTVHSLGLSFLKSYCYKKHSSNYEISLEDGSKLFRELCKSYYNQFFKSSVDDYFKSSITKDALQKKEKELINDLITLCNYCRLYYVNDFSDYKKIKFLATKFCETILDYPDVLNIEDISEAINKIIDKRVEIFLNPEYVDGKYIYPIDFTDMIFLPVYLGMSIPYSLKNSLDTILCDECIPEIHFVETEYGKMRFRELKRRIDKGEQIKVKTFNESIEQFEFKNVVSVTDKGIRPVYEITTTGLNKIQATDNHPFMTQNGWKQLKDLKIGEDYLYLDKPSNQKTKYIPNDDQLQLILGSALGDGSLQRISNNDYEFRIKFVHNEKQLNYLKFKQKMLDCKEPYIIKSGYTNKNNIYNTSSKMFLLPYKSKIDFIKHLDLRGLAILYMDDGSKLSKYDYSGTHISCNSFNLEETNALISKLKEFGVNSINVPKTRNNKIYNELHIDSENAKIFFNKIAPYMHIDCYYKNPLSTGDYKWNNKWKSYGGNIIKSIQYVGKQKVLDMEVKDNHNFFVSKYYQKGGSSILVHNCQDLSILQQQFILKLNTGYNRFIFVGDKNQSIYAFNGADSKAIEKIKNTFKPYKLPLSICYRCPEKVIRLAQDIVPDIMWNVNREDKGILDYSTISAMKKNLKPNDVIIGRSNRDLLKLYKDLVLVDKIKVKFRNTALVNSIVKDVNQCIKDYMKNYAQNLNIDRFVNEHMSLFMQDNEQIIRENKGLYEIEVNEYIKTYIKEHKSDIQKKKIMKGNFTLDYLKLCMQEYYDNGAYKYEPDNIMTSYFDVITEFIELYKKEHISRLVEDFMDYIKSFLNASSNNLDVPVLSSIHTMKGGESDTVYILNYPMLPYKWLNQTKEDEQQELNLLYVATTRAKKKLVLVLLDLTKASSPEQEKYFETLNDDCIAKVNNLNNLIDNLKA